MRVKLIAVTGYLDEACTPDNQVKSSEALIEHAGRTCYRSQPKGTEAAKRFIQRRVEEGHESIIEHASATFEISGISRACSHQLVRHRIKTFLR